VRIPQCYRVRMSRGTRGTRRRDPSERAAERREQEAERRAAIGDQAAARAAWRSAAESWRACDRPVRAVRALSHALSGEATDAAGSALLAGILQDVGQVAAARAAAIDAVQAADDPAVQVLALDVFVGILLVSGEVDRAREQIELLRRSTVPAASVAARFRQSRLDRLDGALDRAIDGLRGVLADLPSTDQRFAAPRAAAWQDIAEFHLLAERIDAAQTAHANATRAWTRSRRRPGFFAAEGLGVRIALARGETPLATQLDNAIEFAQDRGLPLLEAELRIARGRARSAADTPGGSEDLDFAVDAGKKAETPLLEGRARLWRRVCGMAAEPGDLPRARLLLGPDRVLSRHPALRPPTVGN
jgi:hypothetical protein